jgi:hypothetical protein
MYTRTICFFMIAMTFMIASPTPAQVPPLINYQGRLTNLEGGPLDTVVDLTFELYEDEGGASLLWTETHPNVTIINGLFSLILGDLSPFPDELWSGPVRFLGIKIGEGELMNPLTPVVSGAYAMRAGSAGFADAAGFAEMAANVPEGAIRTEHIADSGVALIDIAPDGAAPGQVMKFNGVLWEPGDDAGGDAGGGWIDEGTKVYLAAEGDSVGIGTTSPAAKLQVTGPILSGYENAILDSTSCIGGGLYNSVDSTSVIGGGQVNAVNAPYGTVGGGLQNQVLGAIGAVGGGQFNVIHFNGIEATIGGGGGNTVTGPAATVAGGSQNIASGDYATVAGGHTDTASGNRSFIGGGYANTAAGGSATVAGGQFNLALGSQSTVGGGESDTASGWRSTIGGGYVNQAMGDGATIGGGEGNWATQLWTTVAGGSYNDASGPQATICGGNANSASGASSSVLGGVTNQAQGDMATVGGGYGNVAGGHYSVVAGGGDETAEWGETTNLASGDYSVVSGGKSNKATGHYATVAGGQENEASGEHSTIAGGESNEANGLYTSIGGGNLNFADGDFGTIAGGVQNTAHQGASTISGGNLNIADGIGAAIGGGLQNWSYGSGSTVGGGAYNHINANHAVIAGGGGLSLNDSCSVSGDYGVVSGGRANYTKSLYGFLGGGYHNQAGAFVNDTAAFVGGGRNNQASNPYSCVVGGRSNITQGSYSFIGGGINHVNQGTWSAIPGGEGDTIGFFAHHSLAFGKGVFISEPNRVMLFDGAASGRVGINRDDQEGGISYPIHVGTNSTNGNGAHLTAGGVWTNGSSAAFKDRFEKLNGEEILAKIAALSIEAWRFKGTDERHIGPISEEFVAAFDVGAIDESNGQRDDNYLSTVDVAGVALLAVQELYRKTQEIDRQNDEIIKLQAEIAELKKALETLLSE